MLLLLSLIKIQPHICLDLFCLVNAADFSPDSVQNTFSLEQELLWIIDSYFLMDLFHLLSSPDDNWWTALILTAPIHCRASIDETLMQRHISPNKKQAHPNLRVSTFSFSERFSEYIYLFCIAKLFVVVIIDSMSQMTSITIMLY